MGNLSFRTSVTCGDSIHYNDIVSRRIMDLHFHIILILLLVVGVFLPHRLAGPFLSLRMNLWLFLAIAVGAVTGTFLPQLEVYHSFWFIGLMLLMVFSTLVCKLRHLPEKVFKFPSGEGGSQARISWLHPAPFKSELVIETKTENAAACIRRILKDHGMSFNEVKINSPQSNPAVIIDSGRNSFQRWGGFILHVSVVLIMAGALVGAHRGFEETVQMIEGSTVQLKNRPYQIQLRKFEVEFYRGTDNPRSFASDVVVTEGGKVLGEKRIMVNAPLQIAGVRVFQDTWNFTDDSPPRFISGLRVRYDPGAPLFWSGSLILIAGLFLHFYVHQRQWRFVISETGNKTSVLMGGWSSRPPADFQREYSLFVEDVRRRLT